MRLAPDGSEVRITLPHWCGTRHALAFAQARTVWLEQQLGLVPAAVPVGPGGTVMHRGRALRIEWHQRYRRRPALDGDTLRCGGPEGFLPRRIRTWLEEEALQLLSQDLAEYCGRAGQPAPALKLSRAQRRWGSCSVANTGPRAIRVNWRLVMAPDPVRRSVVAHEVAHLSHFDHSRAFHAHLAALFEGDLVAADGWLRQHGRSLYAPFG
jgi:predicted metal-dependent hydrolase